MNRSKWSWLGGILLGAVIASSATGQTAPMPQLPADGLAPLVHPKRSGPIKELPWLNEGLRLSYVVKLATVQGATFHLIPDEGGVLVDANGNRFDAVRRETSAAGMLINQDTIAALDGRKMVISTRVFGYDPLAMQNPPRPMGMTGAAYDPTQAKVNARIVGPAVLQQYLATPAQGVTAVRIKYKAQGETFDAISIMFQDANSSTVNVYDLATGLQLRWTNVTHDAAPGNFVAGDSTRGDTHINIVELINARDLQVPGGDQPMPQTLANLQSMQLSTSMKMTQLSNFQPQKGTTELTADSHGANWIIFNSAPDPHTGAINKQFYGSNQFLCWWINPAALGQLQKGQVLDEDPVTHGKLSVVFVDDATVAIKDQTGDIEFDVQYDRHNGLLLKTRKVGGQPPIDASVQVIGAK